MTPSLLLPLLTTLPAETARLAGHLAAGVSPGRWLSAGARMFTAEPGEIGRYAAEQGSRLDAETGIMILGALIVLLSSASLTLWLTQARPPTPALVLFNRLARDQGLGPGDRLLLYRIARAWRRRAQPAPPLALLLCPGTLGAWSRNHAHRPRGSRRRRAATLSRAASIRRHLFGPARPAV